MLFVLFIIHQLQLYSQYLKVTEAQIMSSSKIDYYAVLQVSKSATNDQIKKAYKKLAIKWHPDKNPDNKDQAVQRFREISEAYETLSNEQKRKKYDLFGFDGPKISSASSSHFDFSNASDLFKAFFSSYGFDNNSDSTFFNNYFKSYSSGGGTGNTYYKYTTKPSTSGTSGTSSYSSYFSKPSGTSSYSSYSSKPSTSDYYANYAKSRGSGYTANGNIYTANGNVYTSSGATYNASSTPTTSADNEELPPEGQTIKKVHHVTRKFTDGTQQTIQRTTIINSDGSKQITQQNLDGTNKKTYTVMGPQKKKADSPPKSANFSGYNFGKRESTTTTESNTNEKQNTTDPQKKQSTTTQNGYKTYYTTSSGGSTSYKIPSSSYANVTRTYSGGTKVYYADGTQATDAPGSFGYGSYGSYGSNYDDRTKTKVYYTVRK